MTGDERALQDFYIQWNDCIQPKKVDGNIDVLPRGMVKMNNVNINTASLTNYLVRGDFVKEDENNQLLTYSAKMHSIPLKMTFEIEIQADTQEDSWKIWEKVVEVFWPTVAASVRWNYVRIPFQMGFPADMPIEKLFQWSYGSITSQNANTNMKFSVELETYYPIFDKNTEIFKGKSVTSFVSSDAITRDEEGNIVFISDNVTVQVKNSANLNNLNLANKISLENITQNNDEEA